MANHLSILASKTHEQYERQKDMTLKDELPRLVGAQHATGEEWRVNNRKNGDGVKAKTMPSCGCDW